MSKVADALAKRKSGNKNWIAGAIGKPGALHRQLGVPEQDKIPDAAVDKAAMMPGVLGKRARLAKTLKGFNK